MKQLSTLLLLFFCSFASRSQCLTATYGLYPAATYTPSCTGSAANVTTAGYAGEYSKVNVTPGITYIFSSSISTDFITISDSSGTTAFISGTSPVTWTAPATASIIRFYTHTNSTCGESNVSPLRARAIQCTYAPCTALGAQPTGLTLTSTISTVSGTFTAPVTAPSGYLVVRYPAGGGSTPALPTSGTTYTVGGTITGTGLSTGTVVYAGAATSFTATGLSASTTYDFIVYSYTTGTTCSVSYNTTATTSQNRASVATVACSAVPSNITVGTSGNYTSLTAVSDILNSCPITTPVSIQLLSTYSSAGEVFPITFATVAGASATNTVTIKPASGATPVITGSAASNVVLKITGNYITVDGSNNGTSSRDLTISNTSTTSPSILLIGSSGTTPVTNVTVKNSILINGVNTSSGVVVTDGTTLGNPGYFNNISLLNNSVQKAYIGIYAYATLASGNGNGLIINGNDLSTTGANAVRYVGVYVQGVDGATVSNNTIGNFDATSAEIDKGVWFATGVVNSTISGNVINTLGYTGTGTNAPVGLYISSGSATSNLTVSNNTITGLSSSGTVVSAGIYLLSTTGGVTIEKNKINNIKNTNTSGGAYGIRLTSTATSGINTIANNFVSDVSSNGSATVANNGHGIAITSGTGYNIYYNSVLLNTNQTATTGLPAALFVSSGVTTAGAVNVKNNLFINTGTVGTERYAIYSGAANTVFSSIDYNDYYTAGPNLGYIGSNRADLSAVQTGFGTNTNSKNILPVFASATDLHLPTASNTTLANLGTAIAGITTDIDNQSRSSTTPDMGADEFDVPLPITLVSFKGERKLSSNLLTWVTSTELNNKEFEIQRSANGRDFSKVALIASKATNGNSSNSITYEYNDIKPLSGANYYQLKQIDKDSRATYSQIVMIKSIPATQISLSNLYPNPVVKNITTTIETPTSAKVTLIVSSIEGKVMIRKTAELTTGDNQINLDVSRLPAGNYIIKLVAADGTESSSKKFVKN